MASTERSARQAAKEALGTLVHWSTAVSAVAVVVAAHWAALSAGSEAGLVYGASFVVFALLLPAVSLLRGYVDQRTSRLQEVLRSGTDSASALATQQQMFGRLADTVKPLQRGIVLAVLAAFASSVAIVAPSVTVWHHAPSLLAFSLADLLTGLALVCLIGTVAALFPFTWHLLISSDQLRLVKEAISKVPAQPVQPAQPNSPEPGAPAKADGTGADAVPGK